MAYSDIPWVTFWAGAEEVTIKGVWEVCERCRGHGSHTNPNIDGNGLPDEWVQDPEFMQDYMDGVYDVPCEVCNGKRVVARPDREQWSEEYLLYYDQHEAELYDLRQMEEMERRYGC